MMRLSRQHRRGLEDTYRVSSLRSRQRRRRVRIGAPDPALTPASGMVAVTELVERLDVTGRLDAAIGPIKQRRRGHTGGEVLVGIAAAQLAGEDFLVGVDRRRADAAGQALAPLPAPARDGRIRMRADAGYFAGQLARAALFAGIEFAIGARRIAPLWRLLDGIAEADWTDAIDMPPRRWPSPSTARTGGP